MSGVTRFPDAVRQRAARIRLIGIDSDGTLTDRGMGWDVDGNEYRRFDVRDGIAMQWAKRLGLHVIVVSGRSCRAVDHRMADLEIPVFQGARDKISVLTQYCSLNKIEIGETAFLGDDLPDLPALKWCGLPLAVADAHPIIQEAAEWSSPSAGGHGAARDAIEAILEATGLWGQVMERYGEKS